MTGFSYLEIRTGFGYRLAWALRASVGMVGAGTGVAEAGTGVAEAGPDVVVDEVVPFGAVSLPSASREGSGQSRAAAGTWRAVDKRSAEFARPRG